MRKAAPVLAFGLLAWVAAACGLDVVGAYPSFDAGEEAGSPIEDAAPTDARAPVDGAALVDAGADVAPDAAEPPGVLAFAVGDASLATDLVSPVDGPVTTDGLPDGVFDVRVSGPARAFALLVVDDAGASIGSQIWDTYVDGDFVPAALGTTFATGAQTPQLGVFGADGGLVNDDAGRASIPAGTFSLRVAGSDVGAFAAGQYFRVVLETADGGLVRGPVVAY